MNNLRDIIYPVKNYSELSMRLSIIGFPVPSRDVFDICHPDDWKWEVLCSVMDDIIDKSMTTTDVDFEIERHLLGL